MKNKTVYILVLIALVFAAFVAGFYLGKNAVQAPLDIQIAGTDATAAKGKVNINTATKEELMTIPGVGEVLAQRIIDYRNTHGNFQSIVELSHVSGIGASTLEEIWEYVTVGG